MTILSASAPFGRLRRLRQSPVAHTAARSLIAIVHMATLVIMAATEVDLVAKAAFLLRWLCSIFLACPVSPPDRRGAHVAQVRRRIDPAIEIQT
jgi:hypothetical protein